MHHAVDGGGDAGVVGDEDDGMAVSVERTQDFHDVSAGGGIQVPGWLVGEQDRRVRRDRTGDGDPLLLAAGHFGGTVPYPVAQSHAFEALPRGSAALFTADAAVDQRKLDVFQCGQAGDEVEALENKADLPVAYGRKLMIR